MCRVLLIAASRRAHVGSTCFLFQAALAIGSVLGSGTVRSAGPDGSPDRRSRWTLLVSGGSVSRRARPNARRRSAMSRHPGSGCNHAPLPGRRRRGSGMTTPSTATTRSNSVARCFCRQPMQVRTGPVGAAIASAGAADINCRANIEVYRLPERDRTRPRPATADRGSAGTAGVIARRAPGPAPASHRCGCRSASRSAGRPVGRSGPPCRWPATAGSPGPPPGRPWPPGRRQ